tara:strand:- start:258 stop:1040 length:783 start_codon:yes stop_codon:yes gene_type:complete
MQIVSWNVNSIRVRLEQLTSWILQESPDLLAIQETKVEDKDFPESAFQDIGYKCFFAGQKSYNGVAIIVRDNTSCYLLTPPKFPDQQKRFLGVNINGVDYVNVYVPNGSSVGSDKYLYKLEWLRVFEAWVGSRLEKNQNMVLMGDFNIAPKDIDVHDPKAWRGKILCTDSERSVIKNLEMLGFTDAFRLFNQNGGQFSWWDYRLNGFKRNLGLRIDLVLTSRNVTTQVTEVLIDKRLRELSRPSDHAMVITQIEDVGSAQ